MKIPAVIPRWGKTGRVEVTLQWWWFARKDLNRDAFVTWRTRAWWSFLWSDITRPLYEFGMWLGVWEVVVEGGYLWADGRWRWAFWRSPWSVWRRNVTVLEWKLRCVEADHRRREVEMACKVAEQYRQGIVDGREALLTDVLSKLDRSPA